MLQVWWSSWRISRVPELQREDVGHGDWKLPSARSALLLLLHLGLRTRGWLFLEIQNLETGSASPVTRGTVTLPLPGLLRTDPCVLVLSQVRPTSPRSQSGCPCFPLCPFYAVCHEYACPAWAKLPVEGCLGVKDQL